MATPSVWARRVDVSRVKTTARVGTPIVERHSPGLLAGKNMILPVGGGPFSGVTEAPRLDLFLTPPSRPGRGYGAGPAAVVNGGIPDS